MSDDFPDSVRRALAARVGHACSRPECLVPTSGPQDDPAKAVNLGVAAHITAASPGGPRYDASLSAEERSAASNGIWLCQNCAKLIDNDVARFPVVVLRKWKADAVAQARTRMGKIAVSSVGDLLLDVAVLNEDSSSWARGEDVVLQYDLDREGAQLTIKPALPYLAQFRSGGPIAPLEYVMSPTRCPFKWDFPILDFKVLNTGQTPRFLTELLFEIQESSIDRNPLFTIKKDTQRRHAGELCLVNEGECNLVDLNISFRLLPDMLSTDVEIAPPYPYSIVVPCLEDHVEVDITDAFQKAGVDIDTLTGLSHGQLIEGFLVVRKADGTEERVAEDKLDARWAECLGPFKSEVGTLVGEITFKVQGGSGSGNVVKFSAPVFLANENRRGIPRPPSYKYDSAFDVQRANYQKRVQISHSLQAGEADRFTVRIAIPQSSHHRFQATLRDVSGSVWQSVPIELRCFVPRSRRTAVANAVSGTS